MHDPNPHWSIKQHATGPSLRVEIRDEVTGMPVDLTGATAVAHLYHPDPDIGALWTGHAVTIDDAAGGVLRLDWSSGDLSTAGTLLLEFEVTFPGTPPIGGEIETYPQNGYIYLHVRSDLNGA